MTDPLTTLAIRHGTDKFGFHDYTPNYHRLFAPFRDRPVRLLEIGVGGYADEDRGGQSLATWRDYFPQGLVTGIDIQRKAIPLGERVRILQGSQVDAAFLARVVAERGPFDLIVDDGSHRNEHVVESFRLLFPTLEPGGIYVVEDVQTAFMPRFGGSLDLTAPNSVGFFAAMLAGAEWVAGIERFHNMIALRKAGGRPHGLFDSPSWGEAEAVERLEPDADEDAFRAAFARLPQPGLIAVEGPPGPTLAALLRHLFVQVDHREIRVGFPDASIDPLARQIRCIEVHADGALVLKALNDFPSNFAFEPDHPQVREAAAAMEAVLADCDDEAGLVAYANFLTVTRGREAAAPWLARLEAKGATARTFFQLAAGLAQRQRRLGDAARLYAAGAARYPDDSVLTQGHVGALLALGDRQGAREACQAALARNPRDAALHLLMSRVADRQGDRRAAIDHAARAVALMPAARRPAALVQLGEAYAQDGRWEAAASAFEEALARPGPVATRAWKGLAAARAALGDAEGARMAGDRALALSTRAGDDARGRLAA